MHHQGGDRTHQFSREDAQLALNARQPVRGNDVAALPKGGIAPRPAALGKTAPQTALRQQRRKQVALTMRGRVQHNGRPLPVHA